MQCLLLLVLGGSILLHKAFGRLERPPRGSLPIPEEVFQFSSHDDVLIQMIRVKRQAAHGVYIEFNSFN